MFVLMISNIKNKSQSKIYILGQKKLIEGTEKEKKYQFKATIKESVVKISFYTRKYFYLKNKNSLGF